MPKSVFTDAYRELLDLLVETRKTAGVTQVELAERLGRPQPFISYFERGERRVDVIEFVAIAKALGIEPEALFSKLVARLPDKIDI
jgi:transcriptional regulator with XRE-family HTH domain